MYSKIRQWYVGDTLGGSSAYLNNYQDSPQPPYDQWLYWDENKRNDDDTSLTLEFTTLSPCQLVRVAGEGEVVEEQPDCLGDYRSEYISVLNRSSNVIIKSYSNP